MSHFHKNWNHSKVDARREKKFRIVIRSKILSSHQGKTRKTFGGKKRQWNLKATKPGKGHGIIASFAQFFCPVSEDNYQVHLIS